MVRSLLALSLCLLGGGCQQLFGLDKVPDPPRPDGLLPDTPPGECGHRDVATGRHHTCVVDAAGAVWCWGQNDAWQVQAGAAEVVVEPVKVDALPSPAAQVSAGRSVSCARLVDGTVWCWGKNEHGELGHGTISERGVPSAVSLGTEKAIDLEVGAYHVCIRRESDGAAMCWGSNRQSEVGDASATELALPTLIAGTQGLQDLSVGHRHSCGVTATGTVQCWGKGESGQLGAGTASSATPTIANGIAGATSVVASGRATCAIIAGTPRCWGSNEYAQLGNGTYDEIAAPGAAVAVSSVVEVGLGAAGGCSRRGDGLVQCWGDLTPGDGTFSTSPLPRPSSVTSATELATGFYHVCAIVDGVTQCWGDNAFGELGRGARSISAVPVGVTLPQPAAKISVAEGHACAVLTNNDVYCWGENGYGELADGTHSSVYKPVKIPLNLTTVIGVATGDHRSCAWSSANARCWGINEHGVLGTGSASHDKTNPVGVQGTGFKGLAIGWIHTCAITTADAVQCWGYNGHGQLGNGSTTDSTSAVAVAVGTVDQVVAGASHTCARKTDATVQCWGENTFGQLGNGSVGDASSPVAISGLTGVSDISAGRRSTCAISNGELYCWGGNDLGQLGLGDQVNRTAPVKVSLAAPAVDVELAAYGGCVKLADGHTWCWGVGDRGQLANGKTPVFETSPVEVAALAGNDEMSLDGNGGCARTGGSVQCWGATVMLGNSDASDATPAPTKLTCP